MRILLAVIGFCFCTLSLFSQSSNGKQRDSIRKYIFLSQNEKLADSVRKDYAMRALEYSTHFSKDSLSLISVKNAISFFDPSEIKYKELNDQLLDLSSKAKDSSSLADAYYNLGKFYVANLNVDSSYYFHYEAEKLYKAINDDWNTAQVLLAIASIQRDEKDFTGSEILSFEALSYLDKLPDAFLYTRKKAFVYNNLGIVFLQLEQYDQAIKYHQQALKIKEGLSGDNTRTIDISKSNLANVYMEMGNYEMANTYNQDILKRAEVRKENPGFYGLVLGNYAHSLYLSGDHEKLPELYLEALKICDSAHAEYQTIIINQRLAEYYNAYNKEDSAKYYAYRAKDISEKYHNDDLLKSLLILSKVEDDSTSVNYYKEYIELNDSIQKNERAIRDKFFRIRYETNKIEKEKDRIARERLLLMIILGAVLFTFVLIYIILSQRAKNKELKFARQQQETNEEIYNLMLSQQDKVDEARALEKKRISEELHDGILGRLFGTRLSLDSLNMANSDEAIKTRGNYIEQLKDIEQDIRKVSHDLNTDFISNTSYISIIKTLLETQSTAYGFEYEFIYDDTIHWDDISNKIKIHIYRVLQESLQNIYKHANASKVKISFKLKNNVIWLSIKDNGIGFDVTKAKKGIGIKNINSRAQEIEAHVEIKSTKNRGTTIQLKIPVS